MSDLATEALEAYQESLVALRKHAQHLAQTILERQISLEECVAHEPLQGNPKVGFAVDGLEFQVFTDSVCLYWIPRCYRCGQRLNAVSFDSKHELGRMLSKPDARKCGNNPACKPNKQRGFWNLPIPFAKRVDP